VLQKSSHNGYQNTSWGSTGLAAGNEVLDSEGLEVHVDTERDYHNLLKPSTRAHALVSGGGVYHNIHAIMDVIACSSS
jgi:hypothetical protein